MVEEGISQLNCAVTLVPLSAQKRRVENVAQETGFRSGFVESLGTLASGEGPAVESG